MFYYENPSNAAAALQVMLTLIKLEVTYKTK